MIQIGFKRIKAEDDFAEENKKNESGDTRQQVARGGVKAAGQRR